MIKIRIIGAILIIVGFLIIFTPLVDYVTGKDPDRGGVSISELRTVCSGFIGELGRSMDRGVRQACSQADFYYYLSIILIIVGTLLLVSGFILANLKKKK